MFRSLLFLSHALTIALGTLAFAAPAIAQFEELAADVPERANAITLLDVEGLMSTGLAAKEGWKDKHNNAYAAGLVSIAPDTERLLLASQLDYEYMKPQWTLALADTASEHPLAAAARRLNGTLDPLDGTPAVVVGENAYLMQLAPKRYAAMAPDNRQVVARWLKAAQESKQPMLSPFLKASLAAVEKSNIVMAFDLENAIPPDVIRAKLSTSAALKDKNVDVEAATKALAGIRGVAAEVAVTEGIYGRLAVYFSSDASALAPVAKPLLMEILADLGAAIDDIADWKVDVEPQRISFHGSLSEAGRKRVFSLIDHPTSVLLAPAEAESSAAANQQQSAAAASQQYFRSVSSILDEVREKSGNAKTFGENALWFDKWARKIDKLPVLRVDQELVGFGQYASTQLRNMAAALRGMTITSAAREAQVYNTGTSYGSYDGWGGYSYYSEWRNVDGQRRAIRAQERGKGAMTARNIAKELETETGKVRQAMTQKYQVEF